MVQYDATIIQKFVDKLYAEARFIVLKYGFAGGLLGFAGGWLASYSFITHGRGPDSSAELYVGIGVGLGLALGGGFVGYERGFKLRLAAQQALCQARTLAVLEQIRDAPGPSVLLGQIRDQLIRTNVNADGRR
jgi:hypothetical protein